MITRILNFVRNASTSNVTLKLLASIQHQGVLIMATVADLQAAVDKLTADTAAEKAEALAAQQASTDAIKTLADQVTALKAQVAAGTGINAVDLDPILAKIQSIDTAVQAIIPATPAV